MKDRYSRKLHWCDKCDRNTDSHGEKCAECEHKSKQKVPRKNKIKNYEEEDDI